MLVPALTEPAKLALVEYLARKIGANPVQLVGTMPYATFAIQNGGRNMGAVLYTNYRETSIEMMWAGEAGWATRPVLRAIFAYPFLHLGVLRATGCVARSNNASRQFAARIGCREAGVLENEYGLGKDGILYTMTRERCRWLKGSGNGQIKGAEASRSGEGRGSANGKQYRHRARTGAPGHDGAVI